MQRPKGNLITTHIHFPNLAELAVTTPIPPKALIWAKQGPLWHSLAAKVCSPSCVLPLFMTSNDMPFKAK